MPSRGLTAIPPLACKISLSSWRLGVPSFHSTACLQNRAPRGACLLLLPWLQLTFVSNSHRMGNWARFHDYWITQTVTVQLNSIQLAPSPTFYSLYEPAFVAIIALGPKSKDRRTLASIPVTGHLSSSALLVLCSPSIGPPIMSFQLPVDSVSRSL